MTKKRQFYHYKGFLIVYDPTNPIDHPYRVGDSNFKSLKDADDSIDETWSKAREEVMSGIK